MADDLRSLLAEAADAAESSQEPVERERPVAATEGAETEKPASGERPRGPDGKFVAKDAEGDAEEPEEVEDADESGEPEEEPKEETPPAPKVEVPAQWSQADKDMIAALPPEHGQKVVDRIKQMEAGFTPKLMRAAELEKHYGPLEEIFGPAVDVMKQRGITRTDVIRAWYSVERDLITGAAEAQQGRTNQKGAEIVARIIKTYRVDPGLVATLLQGQIASAEPGPQPTISADHQQGYVPPEVARRIEALEQRETERLNAAQQARISEIGLKIDAFVNEKDSAGNLLHPYFSELEKDMMAFAQLDQAQGKTSELADLYDRASYANREVRQKLLSASAEEAKRKEQAKRKEKAAAAQRANVSVTGSPGAGQSPSASRPRASSVREALEEAYADHDAA